MSNGRASWGWKGLVVNGGMDRTRKDEEGEKGGDGKNKWKGREIGRRKGMEEWKGE